MKRWSIVFTVLSILFILLPACGGGNGDKTSTSTPTPTPSGTVKIGALSVWSGPAAMAGIYFADPVIKLVEKQVEEMGGILGGRLLKINKYDSGGSAAGALTAATKAIIEDKLSVVALGGLGGTEVTTIAEVACKENAFFSSNAPIFDTPERKCMVEATISLEAVIDSIVTLITEKLQPKPQTVAILSMEQNDVQKLVNGWKSGYERAGIKTIYEERLASDIVDFSPYLTKIKYLDPDVLLLYMTTANYIAVANQIKEFGGWGNIQVVGEPTAITAAKMPGAVSWLTVTPWYLGMDNPESIKFVQDYKTVNDKSPDISHVYIYLSLITAIQAIELAGTAEDGEAVARAARSGNLKFDTPMGPIHFNADGKADIKMTTIRIEENGKYVPLE